ncbi:MAG: single-stranded DNA-binding protein [Thermoleophilaceae bacterium]|nr:single-stranded DNA-binding protein [Thermoleophilaceae bacterium]
MNVYSILNGRIVADPREFEAGGKTLMSLRVADNPMGNKDKRYETIFVDVVLGEGLANVCRERGIGKGDVVSVSGELKLEKWKPRAGAKKSKKSKGGEEGGINYKIPFVNAFCVLTCAADGGEKPEPEDEDDGEDAGKPLDSTICDDPFED